jgi:hypothetical protein
VVVPIEDQVGFSISIGVSDERKWRTILQFLLVTAMPDLWSIISRFPGLESGIELGEGFLDRSRKLQRIDFTLSAHNRGKWFSR